jgi:hypothetical protein
LQKNAPTRVEIELDGTVEKEGQLVPDYIEKVRALDD